MCVISLIVFTDKAFRTYFHIKGPIIETCLFWRTNKCRTEDSRGGAEISALLISVWVLQTLVEIHNEHLNNLPCILCDLHRHGKSE